MEDVLTSYTRGSQGSRDVGRIWRTFVEYWRSVAYTYIHDVTIFIPEQLIA